MVLDHHDLTMDGPDDGLPIIRSINPAWSKIKSKVFTEGITNKLYGYIDEGCSDKNEMILVRVYGNNTEIIIDRDNEIKTHQRLHEKGFATKVHCTINNGYFYGFVPGNIMSTTTVCDAEIAPLIAKEMARMHCNVTLEDTAPCIFPKLDKWLEQLPEEFTEPKFSKLAEVMSSKAAIVTELRLMQSKAEAAQCPVVFCHNDILLANIIYNPDIKKISFIDYEYGSPNYQGFDIGNHFNEYAGIETVDYNLYPDEKYQKWWLGIYLAERNAVKGLEKGSEADLVKLYNETNFFALASHLFWGIWAVIQALNSDIDFDFMGYSGIRFGEYFKQKGKFIELV